MHTSGGLSSPRSGRALQELDGAMESGQLPAPPTPHPPGQARSPPPRRAAARGPAAPSDPFHEEEVQADKGFPQRCVHPAAHNPARGIGDSVRKDRRVPRQLHRLLLIALRGDSSGHMGGNTQDAAAGMVAVPQVFAFRFLSKRHFISVVTATQPAKGSSPQPARAASRYFRVKLDITRKGRPSIALNLERKTNHGR